jgi:nitroimidazol reductase NimA-like FMN-containing flavoprotein (pyridoxamine 5'-phosphate oxidase superfamily)
MQHDGGADVPRRNTDRNGLEVLTRAESLLLLGTGTIGRIGLTADALPLVLPVNYHYDGERIVIRSHPGTKLDAATRHTVVAFEVDDIDPIYHSGWSVVVQGVARTVGDHNEIARLRSLPLSVWTPVDADRFVTISVDIVSGRRIARPHAQVPADRREEARMGG